MACGKKVHKIAFTFVDLYGRQDRCTYDATIIAAVTVNTTVATFCRVDIMSE